MSRILVGFNNTELFDLAGEGAQRFRTLLDTATKNIDPERVRSYYSVASSGGIGSGFPILALRMQHELPYIQSVLELLVDEFGMPVSVAKPFSLYDRITRPIFRSRGLEATTGDAYKWILTRFKEEPKVKLITDYSAGWAVAEAR